MSFAVSKDTSDSTIWWFYHMYYTSFIYCSSWRPNIHFWHSFEYRFLAVLVLDASLGSMPLYSLWKPFYFVTENLATIQLPSNKKRGVGREMLPKRLVIWKCKNLLKLYTIVQLELKLMQIDSKPRLPSYEIRLLQEGLRWLSSLSCCYFGLSNWVWPLGCVQNWNTLLLELAI